MNLTPRGDDLRKAVKWVSEERKARPDADPAKLAAEAGQRFDLSPKDAEFLLRFVKEEQAPDAGKGSA